MPRRLLRQNNLEPEEDVVQAENAEEAELSQEDTKTELPSE